MNRLKKTVLVAIASAALAATSQAQYNPGDLLLGFTDNNASHPDLILDLGPLSGLSSGVLNPAGSPGHVGLDAPALLSLLNSTYGSLANVRFGVVGATFANASTFSTFATVGHGDSRPNLGAAGTLSSAVDLAGSGINDGSGPTANSQLNPASAQLGYSWTEAINSSSSLWATSANPPPSFPASSSAATTLDLYGRVNTGLPSLLGGITLGTDGSVSLSLAAVPEPATYGILAGLGLLVVTIRRQLLGRAL